MDASHLIDAQSGQKDHKGSRVRGGDGVDQREQVIASSGQNSTRQCECSAIMSHKTALEIRTDEDESSQKWLLPLTEDVFRSHLSQAGEAAQKVFGEGSLFSPLLFGKFFDPADAFPLWDFDSEQLLSRLRSSSKTSVDWSETDDKYIIRAELPGEARSVEVAVCGDKGNLIEISGIWKAGNFAGRDWKVRKWWECGFVRRLEVGDDADCRKMEAFIYSDAALEIIIPKNISA